MTEASIFAAALEKNPDERAAYLVAVCLGDEQLRRRVEALLRAHAGSDSLLDASRVGARKAHSETSDATAESPPSSDKTSNRVGSRKFVEQTSEGGFQDGSQIIEQRHSAVAIPKDFADHPRYRVLCELGEGGMGTVYQAQHKVMDRLVAIKVIAQSFVDHPDALARFHREVKAAAKLTHPNIAAAYDAEQVGNLHTLVMEFVEGQSLDRVLERKGPLPVAFACGCIRQAALGLQHAFEQGMVHRDIKPQNMMLTPKGQIKLLDFGLARMASERSRRRQLTADGAYMGTPEYMAPEQATDARTADIRADIYSLGCTLFCLLTGRPPFQEETAVKMALAHINEKAPPLTQLRPDAPPELAAILARMLAKNPADRYQIPVEVAQGLLPFTRASEKIVSPPLTPQPTNSASIGTKVGRDTSKPPIRLKINGPPASPFANLDAESVRPRGRQGTKSRQWLMWCSIAVALGLVFVIGVIAAIVLSVKTKDGVIELTLDQKDAEVLVDGERITIALRGDNEPIEIHQKPGTHKLEVRKGGFKVESRELTLTPGGHAPVTIRLVPELPPPTPPSEATITPESAHPRPPATPEFGSIRIALSHPSAQVELNLDGERLDKSKLSQPLQLKVGEHLLTVTGKYYAPETKKLTIKKGDNQALLIDLRPGEIKTPDLSDNLVVFKDDFSNPNSGWFISKPCSNMESSYQGSHYRVRPQILGPIVYKNSKMPSLPDDFACEVTGRATGGPLNGCGVSFDIGERNGYLYVIIDLKGQLIISGQWKDRKNFLVTVSHPAIHKGEAFNTLLSVVRGGTLELYVNGCAVCEPVGGLPTGIEFRPKLMYLCQVQGEAEFSGITFYSLKTDKPSANGNGLSVELGGGVDLKMVRVPKGTAYLGGGDGKAGSRQAHVDEFYLGAYEVTQAQWKAVMGADNNPSRFKGDELPVESVSWNEAKKFVDELNKKKAGNGYLYRLPTEVEWEYACRGGPISEEDNRHSFYFDKPTDVLLSSDANFNGFLGKTAKVGSYKPNKLGLYDMHGNVWEWTDTPSGSFHLFRGGCWANPSEFCTAANYFFPAGLNVSGGYQGFRLAASLSRTPTAPLPISPGPPVAQTRALTFSVFAPGHSAEDVAALTRVLTAGNAGAKPRVAKSLSDAIEAKSDVLVILMEGAKTIEGNPIRYKVNLGKYNAAALKTKNVIGIGWGAAKLFGDIGLELSSAYLRHGLGEQITTLANNGLAKVENALPIFAPPIGTGPGPELARYVFGISVSAGKANNVSAIAVFSSYATDAIIARQGKSILIGVEGHAERWSEPFQQLVCDLARGLVSTSASTTK